MLRRRSRAERIFLGPVFSIVLSVAAVAVMAIWGGAERWIVIPASLLVGILLTVEVKARSLFKGPNLPVLPAFLLLQAAAMQTLAGSTLAIVALLSLLVMFLTFQRPGNTRTFYTLFLVAGAAAVYNPLWLLWAAILICVLPAVRAFSLRGLVASALGLLTPYIVLPGLLCLIQRSPEPFHDMLAVYNRQYFSLIPEVSQGYVFSASICVIFALLSFLTAYGYPAKARARNMALYVVTVGAVIMPLLCPTTSAFWLPLINMCAAYHAGHLFATRRGGWFFAVLLWLLSIGYILKFTVCIF